MRRVPEQLRTGPQASTFTLRDSPTSLLLATGELRVVIGKTDLRLAIGTSDGTPLLAGPNVDGSALGLEVAAHAPSLAACFSYLVDGSLVGSYVNAGRHPRWYEASAVTGWSRTETRLSLQLATNDPLERGATLTVEVLSSRAIRLRLAFAVGHGITKVAWSSSCPPDASFHGLGERFGRANHRGKEVVNWIEDSPRTPLDGHDWTYWPVPFFLTSAGYGVLVETTRRAAFEFGTRRPDVWRAAVDEAELNAVVFIGPDPIEILEAYSGLVGRPPVPPLWALGVWKTTLGGQESIRAEVARLRENHLGVSAVWLYDQLELETNSGWGSSMGYPMGEYPDIPQLIRDVHSQGIRVLGYVNEQFFEGRPRYEEGVSHGFFVRRADDTPYLVPRTKPGEGGGLVDAWAALLDPTNPEAVKWWQQMLADLLTKVGYDGWMHDFGELVPADARFANGCSGWELRNAYPLLYHSAAMEVVRSLKPDSVLFVRSGCLGSNKFPPAAWPGDQHCDWSWDRGLPGVIPAGTSVGICGTNTWGPDIGGFFEPYRDREHSQSKELWIRWCQFGALTPIMRDHLGTKRMRDSDAVDLWTDAETVATWRCYAHLHNRLALYLYAYAHFANRTGVPTMRHLVLHYVSDREAREQDYEYLLGRDLLVAPVVAPGVETHDVYFPAGGWYRYWDDGYFNGSAKTQVPAPLNQIPLFVRAGSVLPLCRLHTENIAYIEPDELLRDVEYRVYPSLIPGSRFEFTFHDGSEVAMEEGEASLTLRFRYPDGPARRTVVRYPSTLEIKKVQADGIELTVSASAVGETGEVWFDQQQHCWMAFPPDGSAVVITSYEEHSG